MSALGRLEKMFARFPKKLEDYVMKFLGFLSERGGEMDETQTELTQEERDQITRTVLSFLPTDEVLSRYSPDEILSRFSIDEILSRYSPDDVFSRYSPDDVLARYKTEERLAGLPPDDILSRFSTDDIEAFLRKAKQKGTG